MTLASKSDLISSIHKLLTSIKEKQNTTYKMISELLGRSASYISQLKEKRSVPFSIETLQSIERRLIELDKCSYEEFNNEVRNISLQELIRKLNVIFIPMHKYALRYNDKDILDSEFCYNPYSKEVFTLNINSNTYTVINQIHHITLTEKQNLLQIKLYKEHESVSLFVSYYPETPEFLLGLMTLKKNKKLVAHTLVIDSNEDIDTTQKINHYLRDNKLCNICIPDQISDNKTIRKFINSQYDKGWDIINYSQDVENSPITYDILISTPISSLEYNRFVEVRSQTLKIKKTLEEKYNFKVWYSGENIDDEKKFKQRRINRTLFTEEVIKCVFNSKYFIFIDLEKKTRTSSQMFQLGWVLGQSAKNITYLFTKREEEVPLLVKKETIKHFEVEYVDCYEDIMYYIEGNTNLISSIAEEYKYN